MLNLKKMFEHVKTFIISYKKIHRHKKDITDNY